MTLNTRSPFKVLWLPIACFSEPGSLPWSAACALSTVASTNLHLLSCCRSPSWPSACNLLCLPPAAGYYRQCTRVSDPWQGWARGHGRFWGVLLCKRCRLNGYKALQNCSIIKCHSCIAAATLLYWLVFWGGRADLASNLATACQFP